jgi:hypothetical protein
VSLSLPSSFFLSLPHFCSLPLLLSVPFCAPPPPQLLNQQHLNSNDHISL